MSLECTPPQNRIALFYFLNTIRIVQPLLRVELDVSELHALAESLHEPYVWSTRCQTCFENVIDQLRLLSDNGHTVRVYP